MKRIINNDFFKTPNWLIQFKNNNFDDVDTTNNRAITLTDFSVDENTFEDFMHDIDKELFFVYVSTLSEKELTKLLGRSGKNKTMKQMSQEWVLRTMDKLI